jgi:hypothetical protein
MLCGLQVRDDAVLELARMLDDEELAGRLERAYGDNLKLLALSFSDGDSILAALDLLPGLEQLRGLLVRERAWRVREGLLWQSGRVFCCVRSGRCHDVGLYGWSRCHSQLSSHRSDMRSLTSW